VRVRVSVRVRVMFMVRLRLRVRLRVKVKVRVSVVRTQPRVREVGVRARVRLRVLVRPPLAREAFGRLVHEAAVVRRVGLRVALTDVVAAGAVGAVVLALGHVARLVALAVFQPRAVAPGHAAVKGEDALGVVALEVVAQVGVRVVPRVRVRIDTVSSAFAPLDVVHVARAVRRGLGALVDQVAISTTAVALLVLTEVACALDWFHRGRCVVPTCARQRRSSAPSGVGITRDG